MIQKAKVLDWGVMPYNEAWKGQDELFQSIVKTKMEKGGCPPSTQDFLILLEHPHVYTLGKSGAEDNLLLDFMQLQAKDAEFIHTNRGGDITYHGPGQLVGYPILNLENYHIGLREYINRLEETIIQTIKHYGIHGARAKGAAGVWLGVGTSAERKICAIGVKSSRYVTMHGFALNVNTDLTYFNYINPCGFTTKGVTSLQKELGAEIEMSEVKKVYINIFNQIFKT